MQKYKKIIVSLCVAILLLNIVSPALAAVNEPYDHKALMEYDGYGKAMYETMVDQTTFITGQYTSNKEYVSKSIDQVKDYAKFWWDEAKELNHASLREVVEAGGGYLLTIGDWFKKTFGDYGAKYHPPEIDGGGYNEFVYLHPECNQYAVYCDKFRVNPKYEMIVGAERFTHEDGYMNVRWGGDYGEDPIPKSKMFLVVFDRFDTPYKEFFGEQAKIFKDLPHKFVDREFSRTVYLLSLYGLTVRFVKRDTGETIPLPVKPTNDDFDRFKKYLDEKLDKIATPQPKPYLVCPNGTKIQMSVSGSTFLSADGTTMIVNKDGNAEVNSEICKLGWDKPVVKYIDGRAAIETPDGWEDAETGKKVDGNGGDDDGECGTLCSLGKLAEFVLNFFEKLLDFFIKIFVPEDMDFVSEEFDKLQAKFDDKLGVVGDLKEQMENFFTQENSNPLSDLTISLPATNGQPMKIIETSLIEQHVPTVKKVMSGILVIMTVFYVYRKITGRGGVMEK